MNERINWKIVGFLAVAIAMTTVGWHRSSAEQQPATVPIPALGPNGLGLTPRVVTVKYTKKIYDNVFAHQYNQTAVMLALNESWAKNTPPTPLADQKVQDFDDTSIMIKPTYQIVSGTEGSLVNCWAGPAFSTNPSAPAPSTWTNNMLVVPWFASAPTWRQNSTTRPS